MATKKTTNEKRIGILPSIWTITGDTGISFKWETFFLFI